MDGKADQSSQPSMRCCAQYRKNALLDSLTECETMPKKTLQMNQFFTLGGKVHCNQCQAQSKHNKTQCKKPAMKGKRVCRTHGGASTGPKTPEGRQRCGEARTKTGTETRKARIQRRLALARLAILEEIGFVTGLMSGKRTRGRRPNLRLDAFPELKTPD